jgi:hypothetical protein
VAKQISESKYKKEVLENSKETGKRVWDMLMDSIYMISQENIRLRQYIKDMENLEKDKKAGKTK